MTKETKKYTQQLLETIVDGMQEVKAHDIVTLDLREIPNAIADYYVVCHGESSTQVDSIAKSIERETAKELQEKPYRTEGMQNSTWILVDYISIIVHVFYKETRDFYDIEGLWADAVITNIED